MELPILGAALILAGLSAFAYGWARNRADVSNYWPFGIGWWRSGDAWMTGGLFAMLLGAAAVALAWF